MKKTILLTMSLLITPQIFAGNLLERLMNKVNQEKNEISINKDLLDISYGNTEKQKLDVYLPTATSNKKAILMVHGGAWEIGDKRHSNVIKNKVK